MKKEKIAKRAMILRLLSPLLLLALLQADIAKAGGDGYDIPAVPPIPAPLGCKSTSYVPPCFASRHPPPFPFGSKQELQNRGYAQTKQHKKE